MMLSFITLAIIITSSEAGLLPYTPDVQISSVVHDATSSAVSHQSFTRIHNDHLLAPQAGQFLPAPEDAPVSFAQLHKPITQHSFYVAPTHTKAYEPLGGPAQHDIHLPMEVPEGPTHQNLHHTPAHLTYAASPVIYKTLPMIKPVRSISFAELRAHDVQFNYQH